MTTAKSVKEMALSKIPDLIEVLVKNAAEGDIPSSRLLAELAGLVTRTGPGRPPSKKFQEEEVELSTEEVTKRTNDADDILEQYGKSHVSRS
ncbi:MAG: hypothetical protein E4H28_07245 [Gemmatimonadales bacterium]|nr:MAG: hypothetical protein E4H28_07245 [Gemmatimonadales bacterium]